jgi:hypothetical protein
METNTTTDHAAACQTYLERLGAAEYAVFRNRRNPRKRDRFSPSEYMRALVADLGRGDFESFKARKMAEGYASAVGV